MKNDSIFIWHIIYKRISNLLLQVIFNSLLFFHSHEDFTSFEDQAICFSLIAGSCKATYLFMMVLCDCEDFVGGCELVMSRVVHRLELWSDLDN